MSLKLSDLPILNTFGAIQSFLKRGSSDPVSAIIKSGVALDHQTLNLFLGVTSTYKGLSQILRKDGSLMVASLPQLAQDGQQMRRLGFELPLDKRGKLNWNTAPTGLLSSWGEAGLTTPLLQHRGGITLFVPGEALVPTADEATLYGLKTLLAGLKDKGFTDVEVMPDWARRVQFEEALPKDAPDILTPWAMLKEGDVTFHEVFSDIQKTQSNLAIRILQPTDMPEIIPSLHQKAPDITINAPKESRCRQKGEIKISFKDVSEQKDPDKWGTFILSALTPRAKANNRAARVDFTGYPSETHTPLDTALLLGQVNFRGGITLYHSDSARNRQDSPLMRMWFDRDLKRLDFHVTSKALPDFLNQLKESVARIRDTSSFSPKTVVFFIEKLPSDQSHEDILHHMSQSFSSGTEVVLVLKSMVRKVWATTAT